MSQLCPNPQPKTPPPGQTAWDRPSKTGQTGRTGTELGQAGTGLSQPRKEPAATRQTQRAAGRAAPAQRHRRAPPGAATPAGGRGTAARGAGPAGAGNHPVAAVRADSVMNHDWWVVVHDRIGTKQHPRPRRAPRAPVAPGCREPARHGGTRPQPTSLDATAPQARHPPRQHPPRPGSRPGAAAGSDHQGSSRQHGAVRATARGPDQDPTGGWGDSPVLVSRPGLSQHHDTDSPVLVIRLTETGESPPGPAPPAGAQQHREQRSDRDRPLPGRQRGGPSAATRNRTEHRADPAGGPGESWRAGPGARPRTQHDDQDDDQAQQADTGRRPGRGPGPATGGPLPAAGSSPATTTPHGPGPGGDGHPHGPSSGEASAAGGAPIPPANPPREFTAPPKQPRPAAIQDESTTQNQDGNQQQFRRHSDRPSIR